MKMLRYLSGFVARNIRWFRRHLDEQVGVVMPLLRAFMEHVAMRCIICLTLQCYVFFIDTEICGWTLIQLFFYA